MCSMTEKSDDKVEVKVVVESKDSASKVILAGLTVVLMGLLIVFVSGGGVDSILPKSTASEENCVRRCTLTRCPVPTPPVASVHVRLVSLTDVTSASGVERAVAPCVWPAQSRGTLWSRSTPRDTKLADVERVVACGSLL